MTNLEVVQGHLVYKHIKKGLRRCSPRWGQPGQAVVVNQRLNI